VQSIQIKTVRGQGVNGAEEDEILAVRRFRRKVGAAGEIDL